MIVKDEESHIEQCLLSIKNYVNEMIIVDTGSTDNTIKICEQLGATVYPYTWEEDFSAARNFGIQLCQSEWILWLDADEQLDEIQGKEITNMLEETNAKVISLPVRNYYGTTDNIEKDNYYLLYQPRLFRNFYGITFKNRIHETLTIPESVTGSDIIQANIPIYHYGYTETVVKSKNKAARNMAILLDEFSEPNHSPWIEYHIASELYRLGNNEAAFQFVNHLHYF